MLSWVWSGGPVSIGIMSGGSGLCVGFWSGGPVSRTSRARLCVPGLARWASSRRRAGLGVQFCSLIPVRLARAFLLGVWLVLRAGAYGTPVWLRLFAVAVGVAVVAATGGRQWLCCGCCGDRWSPKVAVPVVVAGWLL